MFKYLDQFTRFRYLTTPLESDNVFYVKPALVAPKMRPLFPNQALIPPPCTSPQHYSPTAGDVWAWLAEPLWVCGAALWVCGGSVDTMHVAVAIDRHSPTDRHRRAQTRDGFADAVLLSQPRCQGNFRFGRFGSYRSLTEVSHL